MKLEEIISQEGKDEQVLFKMISVEVNRLILDDFNGLINILYRLDINEEKLRNALMADPGNAGDIIAGMILERQEQKRKNREMFKGGDSREERW